MKKMTLGLGIGVAGVFFLNGCVQQPKASVGKMHLVTVEGKQYKIPKQTVYQKINKKILGEKEGPLRHCNEGELLWTTDAFLESLKSLQDVTSKTIEKAINSGQMGCTKPL